MPDKAPNILNVELWAFLAGIKAVISNLSDPERNGERDVWSSLNKLIKGIDAKYQSGNVGTINRLNFTRSSFSNEYSYLIVGIFPKKDLNGAEIDAKQVWLYNREGKLEGTLQIKKVNIGQEIIGINASIVDEEGSIRSIFPQEVDSIYFQKDVSGAIHAYYVCRINCQFDSFELGEIFKLPHTQNLLRLLNKMAFVSSMHPNYIYIGNYVLQQADII